MDSILYIVFHARKIIKNAKFTHIYINTQKLWPPNEQLLQHQKARKVCLPAWTNSVTQSSLKDRAKDAILIIHSTQQMQLPCHCTVTNIPQSCHAQIALPGLTMQFF